VIKIILLTLSLCCYCFGYTDGLPAGYSISGNTLIINPVATCSLEIIIIAHGDVGDYTDSVAVAVTNDWITGLPDSFSNAGNNIISKASTPKGKYEIEITANGATATSIDTLEASIGLGSGSIPAGGGSVIGISLLLGGLGYAYAKMRKRK